MNDYLNLNFKSYHQEFDYLKLYFPKTEENNINYIIWFRETLYRQHTDNKIFKGYFVIDADGHLKLPETDNFSFEYENFNMKKIKINLNNFPFGKFINYFINYFIKYKNYCSIEKNKVPFSFDYRLDNFKKEYVYDSRKEANVELYSFLTSYNNFSLGVYNNGSNKIINIRYSPPDPLLCFDLNRVFYRDDMKNYHALWVLDDMLFELKSKIEKEYDFFFPPKLSELNMPNTLIFQLILLILLEDNNTNLLIKDNRLIISHYEEYIPTLNKIEALDRILHSEKLL